MVDSIHTLGLIDSGSSDLYDPTQVKEIDLAKSHFSVNYSWRTGHLPPMILKFPNLEILRAENLGLIVIDEWILGLKQLRELHIAFNEITTWPQHLCLLDNLEVIVMEGNPCLELQFRKSSSFRDAFFHVRSRSNKAQTGFAQLVKSYDRSPALQKRLLFSAGHDTCSGGIYQLKTPDAEKKDDFITTMGPSRLDTRRDKLPPLLSGDILGGGDITLPKTLLVRTEEEASHRSRLIMELLIGITATSGLYNPFRGTSPQYEVTERVPIYFTGGKSWFREALVAFVSQEHSYVLRMQEVVQIFLAPSVPEPFRKELSGMFDAFPEMYFVHCHELLPCYNKFYRHTVKRGNPNFSGLYKKTMKLFESKRFDCYVEYAYGITMSQWKLWSVVNPDSQLNEPLIRNNTGRMGEWLSKEAMNNNMHTLDHAVNYLALPAKRLNQYAEFFKEISLFYPESIDLYHKFRDLQEKVQWIIEESRQKLRLHRLWDHYRLTKDRVLLHGYKWDALLQISFRVYLDKGSYRDKTHDVLSLRSDDRMVMSVVSEIYDQGEHKLRLILCESKLQIWDEVQGKLVAIVEPHAVSVEQGETMRITFESADETCTCKLISFASTDPNAPEGEDGFISALGQAKLSSRVIQVPDGESTVIGEE